LKKEEAVKLLHTRFSLALALVLVLAALLAACGDNTATTVPTTTAAPATTAAATTAAATTAAATTAAPTTAPATTAAATTAAATTAAATTAPATTAAATTGTVKQFNNGQPYTLTIWTIGLKGNKNFENYLNGIYDAYKKLHPNVTIKWEDYGAEIDQKFLTAVASGNAPDVVNFNTSYSLRIASNGALADINKIITPEQKAVYFPTIFDATKVGDAVYSVPWYASLQVAMINKDLFTKAGLDPNKPPKTYQELADAAKAFKDKTDAYAFQPITQLPGEALLEGFNMLTPDKKKSAFDTPEALAKLTYYENLKKGDLIPNKSPYSDTSYDDALARFKAGKLGLLLSGASLLSQVEKDAPDIYKNTTVAPAPVGKSGFIPVDLQGLTIPAASKYKEAALDLALFVTNDENQLAFCHLATILPSTIKASQDPFFQADGDVKQLARKVSANSLKMAKDPTVNVPNFDKLQQALNDNLNAWWAGSKTAQQALDDSAKAWDDILSKQ
jgi:putative chitobiose transport system substrate-binding protein